MTEGFSNYCIVELFGHQKIAGLVSEQVIAGQGFVRVDVPATTRQPAFTRLFGSGAIYSITPVDEETAKRAANAIYVEPVTVYIAPDRQLQEPAGMIERHEDGEPWDDDDERED